jgi:aspartyl-tRNA(Asn)/glutamyl-tRNA(Gln) amidotransferase subunit C
MQIDDKLLERLEEMSFLALSNDEKSRFKVELQEILGRMTKFNEFNTEGVPECSYPLDNVNVFRDDEVQPSLARELILQNAPAKNDEMFIAPKTVE